MISTKFNDYTLNLIEDLSELDYIRSLLNPAIQVGLDTETSGLSYISDQVVGVCISAGRSYNPSEYQGFYLPIRHLAYSKNLPIPEVIAFVQELIDNYKTCFFNRNFDFSMLEKDGLVCPFPGKSHDTQIMCYEATSESYPSLKDYAHNYLKFDVIHFEDNNAKDHNFGTTDPAVSYIYAAFDPVITVLLGRKLWFDYSFIHKIYPIDNAATEAMRRFCRDTVITIDYSQVQSELDRVQLELSKVKAEIFALSGYEFRLTSNQDIADALSRVVTLTQKTKAGKFAVNDEVLDRIDHPLARLIQQFRELEKYRGTYLQKMLTFPKEGIHINYSLCAVPTGRFASGSQKGNDYFANFNIQNVPKVEVMRYVHPDPTIGYIINDDPEGAFCKMKCKGGLRNAFTCPDGYVWISADYSAQEMCVMANMSGEPNLINPLLEGSDIHNYISKQMFGFVDKHHRTRVKVLNFAVNYGAGAPTIARKLSIPIPEAQELLDHYNATLSRLTLWKESMKKEARRKGVIFTYFGRPRVMHKYYNSSDPKMHAFADRTAMNSPVQGFGGDLIRIDHIKLRKLFESNPEFAENVKYICTIHDEINLYVKPSYIQKAFNALTGIMDFYADNLKVPIKTSPSVGTCWGTQIDADLITDNNRIVINREKCEPLDGETEEQMNARFDEWESQPNY